MSDKKDLKKKIKKDSNEFFGGFKEFITRGNIIDLAIGVIIGGAFNKIVSSLVNDILMPIIAIWLKKESFTDLIWIVRGSEIRYGNFIQMIVEFLIIAFSIYVGIEWGLKRSAKRLAQIKAHDAEEEVAKEEVVEPIEVLPTPTEALLMEIRDLLKDNNE